MSLFSIIQRALPQHALSRAVGAVAGSAFGPLASTLMRGFVRGYNIDLSDAKRTRIEDYVSFNDLFTRELAPDARPIAGDDATIASPVDGTVSEFGAIDAGRLIQAKDRSFTARALLGDPDFAQQLDGGTFMTIYLAPYNYHRIHFPTAGQVSDMRLIPGRLFSVNAATAASVDNLFARNERVVTPVDSEYGRYALVAVGALNVGSIQTVWHGVVTPPRASSVQQWRYDPARPYARGATWGQFNLGSTVILLWPRDAVVLEDGLQRGSTLRMGEALGRWQAPAVRGES